VRVVGVGAGVMVNWLILGESCPGQEKKTKKRKSHEVADFFFVCCGCGVVVEVAAALSVLVMILTHSRQREGPMREFLAA
jgi:hypothetical protein